MSGILGISEAIQAVGKIVDDFHLSDKERMALELESRKLDQAVDLAQVEVNKVEAANTNWFVSGWRPFIGWGCGSALLYAALFEPLLRFAAKVGFGYAGDFPVIDTDLTVQVLMGMLGLAGMRSWEKHKKVAS